MEQEPIIPTRYKSKIPHTLSYPVGAEDISDALRGLPQFDQVNLRFSFLKRTASPRRTAKLYPVIGVLYSGPRRHFSASRTVAEQSQDRRWTISVNAVPRSLRHEIQAKILAEALPSIRLWLASNVHASSREGDHGLRFSFDELKNELVSQETSSPLWRTDRTDR